MTRDPQCSPFQVSLHVAWKSFLVARGSTSQHHHSEMGVFFLSGLDDLVDGLQRGEGRRVVGHGDSQGARVAGFLWKVNMKLIIQSLHTSIDKQSNTTMTPTLTIDETMKK